MRSLHGGTRSARVRVTAPGINGFMGHPRLCRETPGLELLRNPGLAVGMGCGGQWGRDLGPAAPAPGTGMDGQNPGNRWAGIPGNGRAENP